MYWQAATHLKSLVKRASLNESHAKAARAYKAKVASLTSERAELRAQMQNMAEEAVKLKSDLRHTSTARARAEGKEEKAREGLRVAEGELREVMDGLQTTQNELRVVMEELQAARDELRNKAVLLNRARCEASEAESSIKRLTDECHALRGDLQRQEGLVVQRDGAIASLRDEAYTQWASGWLAFQRRVANAYPGLDLNFDIPSDEEAKESFLLIAQESQPPRLRPAPLLRLLIITPRLTSEPSCIILLVFCQPWALNPGYM